MILTQLLILGGAAAVGRWLYKAPERSAPAAREGDPPSLGLAVPPPGADEVEDERAVIDRALVVSASGLGAAVVSATVYPPAGLLALGSVAYSGPGLLRDAVRDARRSGRPTIASLDLAAIAVGVVARLYVLSNAALTLYYLGRKLNRDARAQSDAAIRDALEAPTARVRLADAPDQTTDLRRVLIGDRLIVEAGERIPVDGVVVEGAASVDRGASTGEPQPTARAPGDAVSASSLVRQGRLVVEARQTGEQRVSGAVADALTQTRRSEARLLARSQQLADATAPPTFGAAGVALLGGGPLTALAVLGSNFVGALRVASPLSMHAHLRQAQRAGVLIQDGRTLERVDDVDAVVLDRSSALDGAQLDVVEWARVGDTSPFEVLRWAASAAQRQAHPVAEALLELAEERGLALAAADAVELHLGDGVRAQVEGRSVVVGGRPLLVALGVDLSEASAADEASARRRGRTTGYIAVGGALAAVVHLAPRLRPESVALIQSLRRGGRAVLLLSKDDEAPTAHLAGRLGVDGYFAEVSDKAQLIARLQSEGRRVCFVGDALHDAPALARAQLAVAAPGAPPLASDGAQVVLLGEGLGGLAALFEAGEAYKLDQDRAKLAAFGATIVTTGGALVGALGLTAVTGLYVVSAGVSALIGLRPLLRWPPPEHAPAEEAG